MNKFEEVWNQLEQEAVTREKSRISSKSNMPWTKAHVLQPKHKWYKMKQNGILVNMDRP